MNMVMSSSNHCANSLDVRRCAEAMSGVISKRNACTGLSAWHSPSVAFDQVFLRCLPCASPSAPSASGPDSPQTPQITSRRPEHPSLRSYPCKAPPDLRRKDRSDSPPWEPRYVPTLDHSACHSHASSGVDRLKIVRWAVSSGSA